MDTPANEEENPVDPAAGAAADTPSKKSSKGRRDSTLAAAAFVDHAWRHPSAEQQAKLGIVALGNDYTPTPQEQALLDMYLTIKRHETVSKNLKQAAALRKLEQRNASFLQRQDEEKKRRRRRRKKKKAAAAAEGGDEGEDEDDEDDEDLGSDEDLDDSDASDASDEDDLAALSKQKKNKPEQQLQAMRQDVAQAKQKAGLSAQEQEDALIAQHLDQDNDQDETNTDEMIVARKKKKPRLAGDDLGDMDDSDRAAKPGGAPSLLANLGPAATPPHDFSSKLALADSGMLFPDSAAAGGGAGEADDSLMGYMGGSGQASGGEKVWTPPEGASGPNDGAFVRMLADFDMDANPTSQTNNTLAIKFTAPSDSKRFSLNIATSSQLDHDFDSILFHLNPRQRGKGGGQLVMNDKSDTIWGQALSIPLSQLPMIFGKESLTLVIQIHADGFDVFLDNQHCARLEHRHDLLTEEHSQLCLQFPSTDDYGSPEKWKVYKVWWGYKALLCSKDPHKLAQVAGVNSFNSIHPRKLFLRGLPKIHSQSDMDIRRAELERAFGKYGGSRGIVKVTVYRHKTYASVELETERLADLALQEMAVKYQLNRARRTKHEALQEERLAKEQAAVSGGGGRGGGGGGWD